MAHFSQTLEELLPGHLHKILSWDFIPWNHVRGRHNDLSNPSLMALLEAYLRLDECLNLKALASQTIPEESWGCKRCGFCCISMQPGPVTAAIYRKWEEAEAPVAWFYSDLGNREKKPVYRCWFYNGIRLMICPFMFTNRKDGRNFCSIYHMGDEYRPPACSKYVPRHETCTSKLPDIDPWESN